MCSLLFIFPQMIALKQLPKCFLFHLKSSFPSQDIQMFVFSSFPLLFFIDLCFRGWSKKNLKVYDVISFLNKNLKIHRKLSTILKISKKMYEVMLFWYVKVHIFWKFIQCTIHWDKTQILKKFSSDKITSTKNALLFLSRAASHHSFTDMNLYFTYTILIWAEAQGSSL